MDETHTEWEEMETIIETDMSTISIPITQKKELDAIKIIPREPYYEVINRLIISYNAKTSKKKK